MPASMVQAFCAGSQTFEATVIVVGADASLPVKRQKNSKASPRYDVRPQTQHERPCAMALNAYAFSYRTRYTENRPENIPQPLRYWRVKYP
jgi:hypothetical protein